MLMLSPSENVRGPLPVHTPLLIEGLRAAGCDVVSEQWGRHADGEHTLSKLPRLIKDLRRIRRSLSGGSFDVMVVKTSHEWRSVLRVLPLIATVRRSVGSLIVQFHGGRSDALAAPGLLLFKLASRHLFASVDGVLVLSTEEAREYERFFPKGRFRVVSNPYRSRVPRSAPADRAGAVPTVVFTGRLVVEKGILDLIQALARLRDGAGCRLVVCGAGPAEAEARELSQSLGLAATVVFAGHVSSQELGEVYRAADVFVLPSYSEGFPTAITEAMDFGLPIITTRIRGMADHLSENINALFVPAGDPDALALAVERILSDADLRGTMRIANQAKVREFAPDAVAQEYLEAIEGIARLVT
jgi:glycosyltransferase involved in cell wall biosynthesis